MTNTFNNDDYNSLDGMLTTVWGPSLWHSLHTISFNYPIKPSKQEKQNYYNFFMGLKHVLPCRYCRDNFVKNLKQVPLTNNTMKSRETLSKWLYDLHEEINRMLGKKSGLSFEDVRNRYEMFRARCIDENGKTVTKIKEKKSKKNKFGIKKNNSMKKNKKNNGKVIEKGCTTPYYGKKSRCVINIVPKSKKCKSFNIDKKCIIKRVKK